MTTDINLRLIDEATGDDYKPIACTAIVNLPVTINFTLYPDETATERQALNSMCSLIEAIELSAGQIRGVYLRTGEASHILITGLPGDPDAQRGFTSVERLREEVARLARQEAEEEAIIARILPTIQQASLTTPSAALAAALRRLADRFDAGEE